MDVEVVEARDVGKEVGAVGCDVVVAFQVGGQL
jgi:hypothetical protein